jgi:hypothetical protein
LGQFCLNAALKGITHNEVAKMKRAFLVVLFCVVLLAGYTVTRTLLAKEKATLSGIRCEVRVM